MLRSTEDPVTIDTLLVHTGSFVVAVKFDLMLLTQVSVATHIVSLVGGIKPFVYKMLKNPEIPILS